MSVTELPLDVHANDEPDCYAAKISLVRSGPCGGLLQDFSNVKVRTFVSTAMLMTLSTKLGFSLSVSHASY